MRVYTCWAAAHGDFAAANTAHLLMLRSGEQGNGCVWQTAFCGGKHAQQAVQVGLPDAEGQSYTCMLADTASLLAACS